MSDITITITRDSLCTPDDMSEPEETTTRSCADYRVALDGFDPEWDDADDVDAALNTTLVAELDPEGILADCPESIQIMSGLDAEWEDMVDDLIRTGTAVARLFSYATA